MLIWAVKADLLHGTMIPLENQPRSRVCPNASKNAYVNLHPQVKRARPKMLSYIPPASAMDIDEMIRIICKAGYLVERDLKDGCG
jgi:hypothetical protein